MDELISRKAAIEAVKIPDDGCTIISERNGIIFARVEARRAIQDIPSVPAVPVANGRWEGDETCEAYDIAGVKTWAVKRKCSICGFTHKFIEAHMCYTFCPNCGAKMDAKRDDECTDCERDCTMCGVRFEKED